MMLSGFQSGLVVALSAALTSFSAACKAALPRLRDRTLDAALTRDTMSLDNKKRVGYITACVRQALMASRQHPQQDSGARIQEHSGNVLAGRQTPGGLCFAQTKGRVLCQREKKDFSKVGERRGNVYENKGPALRSP